MNEKFDGSERLIEAEAFAKENKLGIWAKPKVYAQNYPQEQDKKKAEDAK